VARAPNHSGKIRLAYLSADFKEHATAYLAAELFERHDRSRFQVLGLSSGPDDGSAMRARLVKAFDQFLDVRLMASQDVAETVAGLGVDILVDLNGHTYGSRSDILAWRPAGVQVSFLGYPGSLGADFVDYVIADGTVLPPDRQIFYDEKIVRLPGSYQVSGQRAVGSLPRRADCGLPETGFVFCCFNNSWKISAGFFDIWMNLLAAVPGSVLWLIGSNEGANVNLRRAAVARGIDPARLIFAPRLAQSDHIARHHLVDLVLDTLPYNAHTTASDALWMGVPVVTCMGKSFAGLVGASLLKAAGLPELATETPMEYETMALRLAMEPGLMQAFRARLSNSRDSALFDTARFCRNIETAYTIMMDIARAGKCPQGFAVEESAI
jgi:predicted O-linked N-acetylglucosamine transferase (SPINDLY family)